MRGEEHGVNQITLMTKGKQNYTALTIFKIRLNIVFYDQAYSWGWIS